MSKTHITFHVDGAESVDPILMSEHIWPINLILIDQVVDSLKKRLVYTATLANSHKSYFISKETYERLREELLNTMDEFIQETREEYFRKWGS